MSLLVLLLGVLWSYLRFTRSLSNLSVRQNFLQTQQQHLRIKMTSCSTNALTEAAQSLVLGGSTPSARSNVFIAEVCHCHIGSSRDSPPDYESLDQNAKLLRELIGLQKKVVSQNEQLLDCYDAKNEPRLGKYLLRDILGSFMTDDGMAIAGYRGQGKNATEADFQRVLIETVYELTGTKPVIEPGASGRLCIFQGRRRERAGLENLV